MSFVVTAENIQAEHDEAMRILNNLRFWTKYAQYNDVPPAREAKEKWEQEADEFLSKYEMDHDLNQRKIIKTSGDEL